MTLGAGSSSPNPRIPITVATRRCAAVFLEGRSQKEVADGFGFQYSSLRQLVYEFRQQGDPTAASSPFFAS